MAENRRKQQEERKMKKERMKKEDKKRKYKVLRVCIHTAIENKDNSEERKKQRKKKRNEIKSYVYVFIHQQKTKILLKKERLRADEMMETQLNCSNNNKE